MIDSGENPWYDVITKYLQYGANRMEVDVIRIGNSKGIRLPAIVLKECNITDKVEMVVKDGQIVIIPVHNPREGWSDMFKEMNASGEDNLLMEDDLSEGTEDWEW